METYQKMDPDVQIMYIVPDSKLYPRSQVRVTLSGSYDRKRLPDEYEKSIDATWSDRLKANPKLWNGTKFRIDSTRQQENSVVFNLGLTSYKEFIGTNWSPEAALYRQLGLADHGTPQAYMSDALGVGALVETADHCMVLLRRSQHCGEAVGLLDIPGGHPEPKELVGKLDLSEFSVDDLEPEAVLTEIFEWTVREIVDEVNIPRDCLSDPLLMGIARNTTSAGRPSSEYYCMCSLTSVEVRQRYLAGGHEEAEESTNITFVPMARLSNVQRDRRLWDDMAPSCKGYITLYQLSQGIGPVGRDSVSS